MKTARSCAAWCTKSAASSGSRKQSEAPRAPAIAGIAPSAQACRPRSGLRPRQDRDSGPEGPARAHYGEYAEDIRGRPDAADHADAQAARLSQPLEETVRGHQPHAAEPL